jgi:hypothetical protein
MIVAPRRKVPRKLRDKRVVVAQDAEESLDSIAGYLGDISDTLMSVADLLYRIELRS